MGKAFWIRRFFTVLLGAFVVITGAQLLRGHDLTHSMIEGAIWGAIAALVFTTSRYVQARKGQHCAICKDTPELHRVDPAEDR
ncbi:MAG: hypothetical protein WC538_00910 [Thermoanaerobaculia bacterium]|jgi:hypothetical protein